MNEGIPASLQRPLGLLFLLAVSPLLALAAAALWLSDPGSVLFRQVRVGRGGERFVLLKLRTMRRQAGPKITAGDDPRITRVGRLIRRLKIDELPALWNVFKGEMALVGPRPEVPQYVDSDNPLWQQVLTVRPGLTDPTTVSLRDEESLLAAAGAEWERYYVAELQPRKLQGYIAYLSRRTWKTDVMVIVQTALAVLRLRRVNPATTPVVPGLIK